MPHFKFAFLIYVIFLKVLTSFALNGEPIVGAYFALPETFQYHVGILSRQNFSSIYCIECGGSIIATNFVISAAHCFADNSSFLRPDSYAVVAATLDLNHDRGIIIDVELIYIHKYYKGFSLNDIAILKLKEMLSLYNGLVKQLLLPAAGESFAEKTGTVSGYGANWIGSKNKFVFSRLLLRFVWVNIITDEACKTLYNQIDPDRQLCGTSIPIYLKNPTGLCYGDSGGPLVFQNKLVGITSQCNHRCDDTVFGSVYLKVSFYVDYIESILKGDLIRSPVYVHKNPIHVL